ncbi:MAG: monovalent cation/H+ antiporter complex subunit F [Clostridia bacterium]|nr:monovalent cation/H+ antiporter complex subunit F [Clostridia bacterium]
MERYYDILFPVALIVLGAGLLFSLIRAIIGPRLADRIMGINMTGSLSSACLAILALWLKESWLLDVSILYCLISFLAVVVLAKINIAQKEDGKHE